MLLWGSNNITYSECVFVALVIQHAMRMRHVVYLWPAPLHNIFAHYLINRRNLEKKKLLNTMCVFSVQRLSETFLIARKIQPAVTITVHMSVCM